MSNEKTKRVVLQKRIDGEVYELHVRNHVDNIVTEDGSNLGEQLGLIADSALTPEERGKIAQIPRILVGEDTPQDLLESDLFLQVVE